MRSLPSTVLHLTERVVLAAAPGHPLAAGGPVDEARNGTGSGKPVMP